MSALLAAASEAEVKHDLSGLACLLLVVIACALLMGGKR